jgi:class 3 adenylate cyclase/pimeloyl-ACP methyl ester carboxylesterase
MDIPDPRYIRTGDGTYLAYQVIGEGPLDIAWQFDFFGNVDLVWQRPTVNGWLRALASFARVILHDRRATGLSSRDVPVPDLETRAADLRAVLDHVDSLQPVIGGFHEGLAPGVLLAATDPGRVRSLVWWNPSPRTLWAPDYPWGLDSDTAERRNRSLEHWGSTAYSSAWEEEWAHGGIRMSEEEVHATALVSRNTCTPDVARTLDQIWRDTDLRPVLRSVQVPAMLIADEGRSGAIELGRYVATQMPAAQLVVLPGASSIGPGNLPGILKARADAVRRFVGAEPERPGLDAVLATVLFTDIVDSTTTQARLGDTAWKDLAERHNALCRRLLASWRGTEHDTAGDGFYATFDGPTRAIRCALEMRDRVSDVGIEIRAGIHTGDTEIIDGKLGGLAASIGARVAAKAGPSQVLVSQTVRDLVAGSGLSFTDAGAHELKGVPGEWRLYSASE